MAAITGAALAISAGTAVYGATQQKRAAKKANAAILEQERRAQGFLKAGQENALAANRKGIRGMEADFKSAIGEVGMAGVASRARAERRGTQALGASDANALSRGLGNSTTALNQRRGVRSETDHTIADIDSSVAGMLAQVHQARARTRMAAYNSQAAIYQGFAPQQASTAMAVDHRSANVAGGISAAAGSISKILMGYSGGGGEENFTMEQNVQQAQALNSAGVYGAQYGANTALGLLGFS